MKGILKKGLVIASLLAVTLSTIDCKKEKDDNTGLLLAALYFLNQSEWSVTMNLTVKQSDGSVMTTATHNRLIEFSQGVNASVQGSSNSESKDLVLTTNEKIRALATSGAQAGAGKITLSFKQNSQSQKINIVSTSLKSGGNADLADDYTTAVGSGSFTLVANDADPTNLSQVVGLTISNQVITVDSIRVVKKGTYSLASATAGETVCDGGTSTASPTIKTGTISASETWSGSILLSGTVSVNNGAVITVPAGTVVFGQRGSSLFFTGGASLVANGTAASPVCFTSSQSPGTRSPGDWGGIVLVGNGFNTRASAGQTEGTTPVSYPGNSNSPTRLTYTIIEFAGNEVAPGDELNNLSMYAVDNSGSGEALQYVQVHRGLDDGFEWWGGNISGKYLVATGGLDDDFDADEGYGVNSSGTSTATLTNLIAVKYPASCGGTFSTDPSSFEMDGTNSGNRVTSGCSPSNNTNQTTAACTSNPTVSNFTTIGQAITGGLGMRLREGMRGTFSNGLIWNYAGAAISCDNTSSSFPNAKVTISNISVGSSGATASNADSNCTSTTSISALPITSLGNLEGSDCGFSATKPDFSTLSSVSIKGAQASDTTKWWSGWTVYRAR